MATFTPVRALTAVVAVAALLLTACGDDDEDGGSAGAGGGPIRIMTWTATDNPSLATPQVRSGVEARVKAINDGGGIGGRPVQLDFCDTEFDPNTEASCARRAVDDGYVAVVGATSFFPNTLPILERAGIAHIGGQGLTPPELSNPISFPLAGGVPGWFYGAVAATVDRGAQRIAIVTSNNAASQFATRLMTAALQSAGREPLRVVDAPIGNPDQAAAAAQAADGSDAVIVAATADVTTKVVQSLRQANYPGIIAGVSATFTDDIIRTLGPDVVNGLVLSSQTVPVTQTDNPAVAKFITEMQANDPAAARDERSMISWAATEIFAQLAESIDGEITAATVLDTIDNLSEPIDTGVAAPYAVAGSPSPLPDLPQLHNPTILFAEVRDGRIVPAGDAGFVNPFELLTGG